MAHVITMTTAKTPAPSVGVRDRFAGERRRAVRPAARIATTDAPTSGLAPAAPVPHAPLKRALDVAIAGGLLVFLAPLLLSLAVLVKLDSRGPAIFRQRRQGVSGRVFQIWKFRTMTVMEDGAVVRQATRDDARVTRLGAVLRRTSLDELPQLVNVLRGEMSLVGPRPHALAHDALYAARLPQYLARYQVKPGITGLAQVRGLRGETRTLDDMAARIEADLEYVDRRSVWLDLAILARTALVVLGQKAAY